MSQRFEIFIINLTLILVRVADFLTRRRVTSIRVDTSYRILTILALAAY